MQARARPPPRHRRVSRRRPRLPLVSLADDLADPCTPGEAGTLPSATSVCLAEAVTAERDAAMTAAWMWGRSELPRSLAIVGDPRDPRGRHVRPRRRRLGRCAPHLGRAAPLRRRGARCPTRPRLVNDPRSTRRSGPQVAALPEVETVYPFVVAIAIYVKPHDRRRRPHPGHGRQRARPLAGIIVDGRMADPTRADEVVVDQNLPPPATGSTSARR